MRPTSTNKLREAEKAYFSYQFHSACQLYRQAFSQLPFRPCPEILEHIGNFSRVLYELDRDSELKFYLPILESHLEKQFHPAAAYALGYIHSFLGSRTRSKMLFEQILKSPIADNDCRIKSVMMLARLCDDNHEAIRLIHSITVPAKDPQLGKLLEIWRCVALRLAGRLTESITRLHLLLPTLDDKREWYCLLSARNALARAHILNGEFGLARTIVERIGQGSESHAVRTARSHVSELNGIYRKALATRTILVQEQGRAMELSHSGKQVRLYQHRAVSLVRLFLRQPSLSIRRASDTLSISAVQLGQMIDFLTEKIVHLGLPSDSLNVHERKLELVPIIKMNSSQRGIE